MTMNNRARLFCLLFPMALMALPGQAQSPQTQPAQTQPTAADLDKQIAALQTQYNQTGTENGQATVQYKQNYQDLVKLRTQHDQTGAQIASAEKTAKTPADKASLQKMHTQYLTEGTQISQLWATRTSLAAKQRTLWAQHMQQIADMKKLYAEKGAAKK